jgi:hypothetical protein
MNSANLKAKNYYKMNKDIREKVWKKFDCKCAYCGNDLEYSKMQVDHINAKYLGGKDNIDNYNPSCRECNFYKSTFTIEGFRKQITTILDRVRKPFIVRLAIKYGLISFKPFDGLFYFEKQKPKALFINGVVKTFTAEQVIEELEDCETLDDAIMFFSEHK